MSYISKIEVNGTEYDLHDDEARNLLVNDLAIEPDGDDNIIYLTRNGEKIGEGAALPSSGGGGGPKILKLNGTPTYTDENGYKLYYMDIPDGAISVAEMKGTVGVVSFTDVPWAAPATVAPILSNQDSGYIGRDSTVPFIDWNKQVYDGHYTVCVPVTETAFQPYMWVTLVF